MKNISGTSHNYFSGAELTKNLREKSLTGGAATYGSKFVMFVIQIGGTAVLARILIPEDFGLVAMVTALTGFAQMFQDAGLSMATVQRKSITHEQVSTLFWIVAAISSFLMVTIFTVSPAVAWLYGDDRLIPITMVFGISVLFSGLGIQHRAVLRRQMRFGLIAGMEIAVQFLATLTGILLALSGIGYWALVGMHALRPLIMTSLVWFFCSWRPGLPKKGAGIRPMIAFGGYLSIGRFMDYLVKNIDNILIGSVIGAYSLGLYSKAYALMMLPMKQVNLPMSNIAITALSRLQSEEDPYRSYFRRAIFLSCTFTMPMIIFAYVLAEDLFLLLLGGGWEGAVPLFRALIPAAFIYTFNGAIGWSLAPIGKSKKLMNIFLLEGICAVFAFAVGINWGALGIAVALSIQAIITRPFSLWYALDNSIIRWSDLLNSISRPAFSSFIAGIGLYGFKNIYPGRNLFLNISCFVLIYFSIYMICFLIIPGGKREIQNIKNYINIIRAKINA